MKGRNKEEIFFYKMRDKIKNMTKQHRQEFLTKAENNKKLNEKSCCWLKNVIDIVNQEEYEVSLKHAENIPLCLFSSSMQKIFHNE